MEGNVFILSHFSTSFTIFLAQHYISSYLFIQKFELNYFIRYAPIFFMLYQLVCTWCQSYTTSMIASNLHPILLWQIDEATEDIKKTVKRIWFFITLYIVVSVALALVTCLACVIQTPKEYFFFFEIAELYFPQWKPFYTFTIKSALFVLAYTGVSIPGFASFYFYGYITLQKLMLKHCVQNINTNYDQVDNVRFSSVTYQRVINQRLLFCVKRHIRFCKSVARFIQIADAYVLPYQVLGTIVTASIFVFSFAFEGSLAGQYFRIATFVALSCTIVLGFVIIGQEIEDMQLLCTWCQSYTTSIVARNLHSILLWQIDEATEEIKKTLKRTWFFITLYIVVSVAVALLTCLACVVQTPKEFFFFFEIAEQYFPQWKTFFTFTIKSALFVLAYTGVSIPGFASFYFYGHITLQKLMLKHCLQNINTNYDKVDNVRLSSVTYQRLINQRLLFCVTRHIDFCKYVVRIMRLLDVYVLPYEVLGTVVTASIFVFSFAFEGSLAGQYFRIATFVAVSCTIVVGFVVIGQEIEDMWQELSDAASEVEWYNWNQTNKRIYLIFLTNTSKVYKVKFSENISVNYELGLQVLKAVYSAANITYSLQHT
ncbi:hypothetical protein Zmor_023571 [Zophobas morio]|uniref:Odorant receptor n=1 Tax=Zophobas morio TaxID=2755281 RepID=A0AA38M7I0_9CUCU|nr:hypothetical protein Zmor_023571 [Zophobas morio]